MTVNLQVLFLVKNQCSDSLSKSVNFLICGLVSVEYMEIRYHDV